MTLRLVGARVSQFDHEEDVPEDQNRVDKFLVSPNTVSKQAAPSEKKFGLRGEVRAFSLKQREHLDWHVARRLQSLHDAEESRVRFAKVSGWRFEKNARSTARFEILLSQVAIVVQTVSRTT